MAGLFGCFSGLLVLLLGVLFICGWVDVGVDVLIVLLWVVHYCLLVACLDGFWLLIGLMCVLDVVLNLVVVDPISFVCLLDGVHASDTCCLDVIC